MVVVDPWRSRNFFEDIGAWFQIMLQDDYPDIRVDMIYGQVGKVSLQCNLKFIYT